MIGMHLLFQICAMKKNIYYLQKHKELDGYYIQFKYCSIVDNDTKCLTNLLIGKKDVGTECVYKLKCKPNNSVNHVTKQVLLYKAMLKERELTLIICLRKILI